MVAPRGFLARSSLRHGHERATRVFPRPRSCRGRLSCIRALDLPWRTLRLLGNLQLKAKGEVDGIVLLIGREERAISIAPLLTDLF